MLSLENIIKMTQEKLYNALRCEYSSEIELFGERSFILVKGDAPVMLVAHLDTVHSNPVSNICKSKNGIWMAPEGIGGDDRCGVFCLMTVREKADANPWLLFTCDEEKGGIGAHEFVNKYIGKNNNVADKLRGLKYIIEIDRKGENDAVYYDCGNKDFETYIESKGFKTQYGSYSDISTIAPELGTAAVNLSSGYYNAHTQHEYININHLQKTIDRVIELVNESTSDEIPAYEYVEAYCGKQHYVNWYCDSYGDWGDDIENESYESSMQNLSEFGVQMYNELLDLYFPSELKKIIDTQGEEGLEKLYKIEFIELIDSESNTESKNSDKGNTNSLGYLPADLYQMYQELLQIYTSERLHNFRRQYGDEIIRVLYNCEYGHSNTINYSR